MNEGRLDEAALEARRRLMQDALDLATAASKLLDKPQRWARRAYALDSRGRSVAVDDPSAVRFCVVGALLRAEHDRWGTAAPNRTAAAAEIDDLDEPILPPEAPLRLRAALEVLCYCAVSELAKLGIVVLREAPSESAVAKPVIASRLHVPLLFGLHPSVHFERCQRLLLRTQVSLRVLLLDDDALARVNIPTDDAEAAS